MLNNICIMGRLTHDPELRRTASATPVCSFTIACSRNVKSGDEKKTDFLDCVSWRGVAEFVTGHFKKGDAIIISGRLQSRDYEDKNGNKRKAVEIVAYEINFAGNKREGANSSPAPAVDAIDAEDVDNDELPF